MKTIQTRTAAALLILAGSIIPAYAQNRGDGNGRGRSDRPQQHQQHQQQQQQQQQQQRGETRSQGRVQPQAPRPQAQTRQAQPPQAQPRQQFDRGSNGQSQRAQQPRYQQQSNRGQQNYQRQNVRPQSNFRGGNSFQNFTSHNWQNDHRNWSQRGGYRGYHIPQNRFSVSFGRQHYFRIGRPVFYNGYPRFQYGGYSFLIMDPWPDYWGDNWYDSDDVYIDYQNDGYYMYNRRYPGVGISVNIDF